MADSTLYNENKCTKYKNFNILLHSICFVQLNEMDLWI